MYTDEAILIPPEADTRMGRRDIQAFWTQQANEAENLTVTLLDVKPIGPDAARAVLRSEVYAEGAASAACHSAKPHRAAEDGY